VANYGKLFLSFRGKTGILHVSESDFTVRVLPLEPTFKALISRGFETAGRQFESGCQQECQQKLAFRVTSEQFVLTFRLLAHCSLTRIPSILVCCLHEENREKSISFV
jgi:hypothetical protein